MSTDQQSDRAPFERPHMVISNENKERVFSFIQYFLTTLLLLFIVVPLLWLFVSSIRTPQNLFSDTPIIIPDAVTLENYVKLLQDTDFLIWLKNSLIVAFGVMILTTLLSTLGGYGLARAQFYGKKTLARSVLLTYMYPAILLAIPLYILFVRLNLINSYMALILGITGRVLPFGLWLMWQQFQSIPTAYEESAWMDGAGVGRTLFEIILPMVYPGIVAVLVFSFAVAWNQYTLPKVLVLNPEMYTITLGVESFTSATWIEWGHVLSSSVLTIVPGLALILVLQKHLLRGFGLS